MFRFFFIIALASSTKICNNCKHFIKDTQMCRQFAKHDIVTGKISFEDARIARIRIESCGEEAVLYEENKYKILTDSYYFTKEYGLWMILAGLFLSSLT